MIPKIRKLLKSLIKIFLVLTISSLLMIILMTIGEFISIDLNFSESSIFYSSLYYFIPFACFLLTLLILLKYKSFRNYIIIVLITVVLYFVGKMYATKIIKPFQKATQLIQEASIDKEWTNTQDPDVYLQGQEKYVNYYKEASEQNFGYEDWIKKFYVDLYEFKNDMYEKDKQIMSGELILTQEEMDIMVEDSIKEQSDMWNNRLAGPFWMGFYKVKY